MKYAAIDIGNVCIAIDKNAPFKGMGFTPTADFSGKLTEFVRRLEFGEITEDEFFSSLGEQPECQNLTKSDVMRLYDSILLTPVAGMRELLTLLPDMGVTPVFFSDISTFHLEGSRQRFPEMRRFEGIYSFNFGAYKPSEILFEAFEKKYGKPVIYTDDRMELITAAREYGWNAHCFVSAEELKKQIISCMDL